MIIDVFAAKVAEKLPFVPNGIQRETLWRMSRFLLEGTTTDRVFLLKGYAGTGKTSLVGALVKAMTEGQMKAVLMAPTGRAAKVFAAMSGQVALTVHKVIYRQQQFSADFGGFQLMDNLHRDTLFICDEASMVASGSAGSPFGTGDLLDDLIEYVYSAPGCRLLLVGDDAQLPPVGQLRSPALEAERLRGYGLAVEEVILTEVARQQLDSGILYNATHLRDRMRRGDVAGWPPIYYNEYPDVERVDGRDLAERLADSYSRPGLEESIVITRSNYRANRFNMAIRNQILDREEELESGDRLLVVRNNYYWGRGLEATPFIANGDIIEVRRVRRVESLYGFRFAEASVTFPDYEYDTDVLLLLDALATPGPSLPLADMQRLFEAVMEDYADIRDHRSRIKAVKEDRHFNALQVKYGYAVTCHKAQGGQWEHVYLDLGNLNPERLGLDFHRWMYTAVTRARSRLLLVNMPDNMVG